MATIHDVDGFWVEDQAADLLNAQLVKDIDQQFEDIDLVDASGRTYSVKFQKAALRTQNFSFEVKQATIDRRETKPGNFLLAKAAKHILAFPTSLKRVEFLVVDAEALKNLVLGRSWRRVWNGQERVEDNVRRGQKFVEHQNTLVPVSEVRKLAERALFIELA